MSQITLSLIWFRAGFLITWRQLPPKHTWELVQNAGFQGHPPRSAEVLVFYHALTGSSGDFKGWTNHIFLSPGQKNITWEALTAVFCPPPDTNETSTRSKDQVTEKTQPKLRTSQDKHRRRGIQPCLEGKPARRNQIPKSLTWCFRGLAY